MAQMPTLLTKENIGSFLNSFDSFLTDCDGVVWSGDKVIDRADVLVNKLSEEMNKKVFFLTNNSLKTREEFAEKAVKLGFKINVQNIVSSAYVLAAYLKQMEFGKKVYVVGSEGIGRELDKVGIPRVGTGPDVLSAPHFDMVNTFKMDPDVGAVAVGYDPDFSLPKIFKAASYINSSPEVLFLASNTDESFPVSNSKMLFPGTGCFVRCIETVVEKQALVMGKPDPRMFEVIKKEHNLEPSRTLMVGDRCNTDILLGKNCGLATMLVLTGCHSLQDVRGWVEGDDEGLKRQVPHYYIESLGALLDLLHSTQYCLEYLSKMVQMPTLLTRENVNDFLNSFDNFLTDCDGVLWSGDNVIDRANILINKFSDSGKKVFFLTNSSLKTREEYAAKGAKLGFNIKEENIVSSGYVLATYLKQMGFKKKVYLVGSEGIVRELDKVGIPHVGDGPDVLSGPHFDMVNTFKMDPAVGAVVVAYDHFFSLPKIFKAASYINASPEVLFLASNTDEVFPVGQSKTLFPGTGCFVRCIETVVEKEALVMGKPDPRMFEVIKKEHNLEPSRTLMVGDRCNTDILLGKNCGLATLLVLTGCHSLQDVRGWVEGDDEGLKRQVPHYYIESLGALLDLLH